MDNERSKHFVTRVDMNHLLSKEQIEVVKKSTHSGDTISFQIGESTIEGVVNKKYEFIFTTKDGRSYTWIEYIMGSPKILAYLHRFHPIVQVHSDTSDNEYKMPFSTEIY